MGDHKYSTGRDWSQEDRSGDGDHDREIAYTALAHDATGLLQALDDLDLDPDNWAVVLHEPGDQYTLRSEDRPGVEQALRELQALEYGVVRVFRGGKA